MHPPFDVSVYPLASLPTRPARVNPDPVALCLCTRHDSVVLAFVLKKLVGRVLMPLPLSLLMLAAGVYWLRRPETSVRGRRVLVAAGTLLYLASLPAVAWILLTPLEANSPGFVVGSERVDAIAVLGAGYHPVPGRPPTAQVSSTSVVRVAEAVRIARHYPQATLHCSGWGAGWVGSNAEAACDLAVSLGVSATRVVLHPDARDTDDEAEMISAATKGQRLVVVTHAAHMPRSMAMFEAYGANAIAAPTGHVSGLSPGLSLLPSNLALGTTTGALHEWLGRAWFALTRQR